jgi:hypothetical protein
MNEKSQSLYKFIILCISTAVFYASVKSGLLWDLNVYDRAVYDFINNDFPYRTDISLQFVYHPYVLMMLDSLRKVLALKPMLMLLYLLATIFFGKQLFQYVCLIKQKEKLTTSLSIFWLIVPSIGFGGAGIDAFQTGNLTLFLHFLVLGTFFTAKKNSTCKFIFLFQCSILFAAIVKPYYLAYLILLIYLTDYRRFTLLTLITVSLAAVIWLSASIFTPNLYEQFVTSLVHQTLGKGDLGYAIFGLLRRFTGDSISILVHVAVMLLVLMGIIVFIKQEGYDLRSEKIIPLVIAFIIFLNPRMKEYDFIIAIFFSYLFLFLVNQPVYLKAVCLSWGIATVPLFSAIAIKLGLMEPIKILTAQYHFQILGFLVLSVFLMLSIKFTKTS